MSEKDCHKHDDNNTCCKAVVTGVAQTLDEMDFERGIWHAALYNDMPRLTKLLRQGVSPNIKDVSGYTALHYAARAGHYDICKNLLDMGADANVQTRCGQSTPLHRAAMMGHIDIMHLLLKFGADINIQDDHGDTPLHYAIKGRNWENVIR